MDSGGKRLKHQLDDTLAKLTNKKPRDSLGRFVSKTKDTTTTNSPPAAPSGIPVRTNSYRSVSSLTTQLSGFYEFVDPATQHSTPFSTSPIRPTPTPLPNSPPSTPTSRSSTPESSIDTDRDQSTTTETEEMASETITPFQGDREDESPEDFLRAYYRRMGDKSDDFKKSQFPYYLQADDEWFTDLIDDNKKTWKDIEAAFMARWPRKKQVKKTDDEYEDEIMGRKLKDEDLGKKEKIARREVYTHIAWADKMAQSVKGAKWEKTTNQLRQVRKDLRVPMILREKIGTGHADWNAFLEAVRDVDVEYICDSIDIRNKEQAVIDQRIRRLEYLSRSPTAPLRQQLSTVTISSPNRSPQVVGDPFSDASGGRGNLTFAANPTNLRQTKPPFANTNPRPAPTQQKSGSS